MRKPGKRGSRIALFSTKYLPSAVIFTLLLGACAGGYQQTLDYAHTGAVELSRATLPMVTAVCESEIAKCELSQDADCPGYHECKMLRRKIVSGFMAFQEAIDAIVAIKPQIEAMGDKGNGR